MKKILYFLQVLLISFEALVVLISITCWQRFENHLNDFATAISPNAELTKYLMLIPMALFIWIANELRQLVHDDKSVTRFLLEWDDYWKIKYHIYVSLLYALIFVTMSIAPWMTSVGIRSGFALLIFLTSLLGQVVLSATVYDARLRMKELLSNVAT